MDDAINNTGREMLCGREHAVGFDDSPRIARIYIYYICGILLHAAFTPDILQRNDENSKSASRHNRQKYIVQLQKVSRLKPVIKLNLSINL